MPGHRLSKGVLVIKRLVLFALLVSAVACQKSPAAEKAKAEAANPQAAVGQQQNAAASPAGPQTPAATPPAVKPVPEQLPEIIAKVNGETIGKDEFERAVRSLEAQAGQPVPAERRSEIYRGVLDQMIAYKLLLQQSKARKITIPDSEVDDRVKTMQSQFPSEQAFDKALNDQHVTLQQVRDDQRQQMLISKVLETSVSVEPSKVEEFYKQNPDKFQQPEGLHVKHILIVVPQGADGATKAKAKAEADAILKQVKAGTDFSTLARQKSQDSGSAQNGGDMVFGKGQGMVPPAFEEAASKLKPGEISPVVETPYGYDIVKMVEREPARVVPLEEARPRITDFLKQQEAAAFVDSLKAKSKIEIFI